MFVLSVHTRIANSHLQMLRQFARMVCAPRRSEEPSHAVKIFGRYVVAGYLFVATNLNGLTLNLPLVGGKIPTEICRGNHGSHDGCPPGVRSFMLLPCAKCTFCEKVPITSRVSRCDKLSSAEALSEVPYAAWRCQYPHQFRLLGWCSASAVIRSYWSPLVSRRMSSRHAISPA